MVNAKSKNGRKIGGTRCILHGKNSNTLKEQLQTSLYANRKSTKRSRNPNRAVTMS